MNWKFTDSSSTSVVRTNADGSVESCLISAIDNWLIAGNIPSPPDPKIILPVIEVKSVQALHALALTPSGTGTATLYDDVIAWINTQPLAVQIDFNKRDTFTITHPAIQAFKTLKGWTNQQLQDLFTLASTL